MSIQKKFLKDPAAVLDYSIDWSEWLGTDTISTSTWTVATGLTVGANQNANGITTVWISGGTAGSSYAVTNKIVTAGGRTDERTFYIAVVNK